MCSKIVYSSGVFGNGPYKNNTSGFLLHAFNLPTALYMFICLYIKN